MQTMKNLAVVAALTMAATSAQAALSVPAGNSLVVNSSGMNLAWTRDANLFSHSSQQLFWGRCGIRGRL
jgi:hypothetical protein